MSTNDERERKHRILRKTLIAFLPMACLLITLMVVMILDILR